MCSRLSLSCSWCALQCSSSSSAGRQPNQKWLRLWRWLWLESVVSNTWSYTLCNIYIKTSMIHSNFLWGFLEKNVHQFLTLMGYFTAVSESFCVAVVKAFAAREAKFGPRCRFVLLVFATVYVHSVSLSSRTCVTISRDIFCIPSCTYCVTRNK